MLFRKVIMYDFAEFIAGRLVKGDSLWFQRVCEFADLRGLNRGKVVDEIIKRVGPYSLSPRSFESMVSAKSLCVLEKMRKDPANALVDGAILRARADEEARLFVEEKTKTIKADSTKKSERTAQKKYTKTSQNTKKRSRGKKDTKTAQNTTKRLK